MLPADTALAKPEPAKVPARLGIQVTNIEEGWRLATMMAKSELVPKNFRNKPEDVLVAIQMGSEIGLAPMQALQSIAVINGRPGVWGDGFLALIMASPRYQDHDEYFEVLDGGAMVRRDGLVAADLTKDATCAVCTFHRKGKATEVTRRFSIGQAKKAALFSKEGPWQTYPDRMLLMRARSLAGRDCFPDLLRGVRTAEELVDLDEGIDPQVPKVVQRRSESVPLAPVAASSAGPGPVALPTIGIGPIAIKAIETQSLTGPYAILANGEEVEITAAQAEALQSFVGTPHQVRLTCEKSDAIIRLVSFSIED